MSYRNKGAIGPTVTVSIEPDRSGNYVCPGVASDVQLQLALDYAGAREGLVFIKANLPEAPYYDITAPLSLTGIHDLTLQGQSRGKSLNWSGGGWNPGGTYLRLADGVDDHLLEKIEAATSKHTGITIRDITLDGNGPNQTAAAAADVIHLEQCKNGLIQNATVIRGRQNNIFMDVCENWRISHSEIRADGNTEDAAVYLDSSPGIKIDNCIILGANAVNSVGLDLLGTSYFRLDQTSITDNYFGVDIRTLSHYNTIINSSISDNTQTNIRLREGSSYNKISNCRISNATNFDGIANAGGGASTGNMIVNNHITDNPRYGVSLAEAGALANMVKDNIFVNNGTAHFNDTTTANTSIIPYIWDPVRDPDGNIGDHPCVVLTDGIDIRVRGQLYIPMEFQELYEVAAMVVAGGAGNLRWNAEDDWGKENTTEAYNTGSDAIAATDTAVLLDDMTAIPLDAAFTGIAAGDGVGLEWIREGSHANDTVNADCYFRGFRMRYV